VVAAVESVVTKTVDALGGIDILVNGAAGNFVCLAENLSPNGFGTVVDLLRAAHRDGVVRVDRDRQGVIRVFQGAVQAPAPPAAQPSASYEPVVESSSLPAPDEPAPTEETRERAAVLEKVLGEAKDHGEALQAWTPSVGAPAPRPPAAKPAARRNRDDVPSPNPV
jgi:hypothetical protein